jgi:hypothetical protein
MSHQAEYCRELKDWIQTMLLELSFQGGFVKEKKILEAVLAELSFSSNLEQMILRIWWGVLEDIYQF